MSSNLSNRRFIIIGLVASFSLLALYFGILSLANSFSHALEQFSQMGYWILLLVAGFGLQVGLYFFIRASFRLKQMASPTAAMATSGGISTGSMIACCLHHLVDVLPLIGLAAAAAFLTQYQLLFIIIGIFSNLIGITIMLEIIQKHKLSEGFLKRALIYNMNRVKKIAIGSSLVLFLITFFLVNSPERVNVPAEAMIPSEVADEPKTTETINLLSKTDSRGEVSFEVTPLDFSFNKPVEFEIRIDTHSGSLDFDMVKVSILEDEKGNKYQPLFFQGSPPGGHHRSGTLVFPKLEILPKKIKLSIKDIVNLPPRVFEWDLP